MVFNCLPRRTLSVSVTGGECVLHCNHCNGHYLQHMVPVTAARRVLESGAYRSILLSGGSDTRGRLPLVEHLAFITWVHEQGIRINAHAGLQSDEDIHALAPFFDKVSLDYVWDDGTVHDVYHLQRSGADYLHAAQGWTDAFSAAGGSKALTSAKQRVNLHLTIGLKGGVVVGEYAAIDSLIAFQPASLVFLVLVPTEGTVYDSAPVVPIDDVESVFAYARLKLPSADLVLGCMHPRVAGYGEQLVHLAERYQFRGVVGEQSTAEDADQVEECCVFYK
ncbi:MAG: radical SAM protein [Coprothermobacter sp.]|nr:radical SAM protein [Coprothermobacter sp.]